MKKSVARESNQGCFDLGLIQCLTLGLTDRVQSSNGVTRNYGNYPYGNYIGNAPVSKVITLNT